MKQPSEVLERLRDCPIPGVSFDALVRDYNALAPRPFSHECVLFMGVELLRWLISTYRLDLHGVDAFGRNVLFYCPYRLETFAFLLQMGVSTKQRDIYGRTVLESNFTVYHCSMFFRLFDMGISPLPLRELVEAESDILGKWQPDARRRFHDLCVAEECCSSVVIAFLGLRRRFTPSQCHAFPRDIHLMVAKMMWSTRRNEKWH
jgi:hypothetical protein